MMALILATVFIYFYTINTYAVNVPMKDDYDAILDFLNKFSASNLGDKITLLFSQHNEHRILSSRIVYALSYLFTGGVNFVTLGLIANLQLAVIAAFMLYLLWRLVPGNFAILSSLMTVCVFDLSNYENSIMSMEGMQNYGIVMLFMLAMFFSSRNERRYIFPTALTTVITIFSSGNGVIAAFFILMYNLFIANRRQKIVLATVVIVCVPLYFLGYHNTSYNFGSYDIATSFSYFFSMAGAHFAFGEITNTENANIIGALIVLGTLVSFPYGKKMLSDKFLMLLFTTTCFVLCSMLTVALFRSQTAGNPFYASRYMLYPNILFGLCILIFTYRFNDNQKIFTLSLPLLILLCVYSYTNNYTYGEKGLDLENSRLLSKGYYSPESDKAALIAVESCNLNIYCIDNHR